MMFQLLDKIYTGNANKAGYLCMGYDNNNNRMFICLGFDDVAKLVRNGQVYGITMRSGSFTEMRGYTKPRGLTNIGRGVELSLIKEFVRYKNGLLPISVSGIEYDQKTDKVLVKFSIKAEDMKARPKHPVTKFYNDTIKVPGEKKLPSKEFVEMCSIGCCELIIQNNCIMTSVLPENVKSFKRGMITWVKTYKQDIESINVEVKTSPYGKTISQNVLYAIDTEAYKIGIGRAIDGRISKLKK